MITFYNFETFVASVRELILRVYGKNKQDIKSIRISVEMSVWYQNLYFFFHVESIFDVTRPDPTHLDAFPSLISREPLELEC